MFGLNQLKINWKLRLLIGMALLGLVVFGWVSFSTLQTVEINGPLYKNTRSTVDLDGDLAPAPMNLNAARLSVYRAMAEQNPVERAKELENLRQAAKDFSAMFEDDVKGLPDGAI